jgi:hypothetical protein
MNRRERRRRKHLIKQVIAIAMACGGMPFVQLLLAGMAMGGDWMPSTRAKRITLAKKWMGWFADYAVTYGIPAGVVDEFTTLLSDLIAADDAEGAVNSSNNVELARLADLALQESMRSIKKHYLMNPPVPDNHLKFLEVYAPGKSGDPIPKATNPGQITDITSSGIHILKAKLGYSGFFPALIPRSSYKYLLRYCIVDPDATTETNSLGWAYRTTAPTKAEDFPNSITIRRNSYTFNCPETDRGKRMYFVVCLVNDKGEEGPCGPIQYAYIP